MSRIAAFAVVGALLLAACAGDQAGDTALPTQREAGPEVTEPRPTDPPPAEHADPATGPEEQAATEPDRAATGEAARTPEALDFEASLVGGGTFRGSDHDGRDVALWFWAPW